MVELHPQFLRADGKDQFVILPHKEFVALCELLEDLHDLRLIEQARQENAGQPGISLQEMRAELRLDGD